jgi:hypothetical protein
LLLELWAPLQLRAQKHFTSRTPISSALHALKAAATVIAIDITQMQPLGQIVSLGRIQSALQQQGQAALESDDDGVVPCLGVSGISLIP